MRIKSQTCLQFGFWYQIPNMYFLLCKAGVPAWKNLCYIFSNASSKGSEIMQQILRNHKVSVKVIGMFLKKYYFQGFLFVSYVLFTLALKRSWNLYATMPSGAEFLRQMLNIVKLMEKIAGVGIVFIQWHWLCRGINSSSFKRLCLVEPGGRWTWRF